MPITAYSNSYNTVSLSHRAPFVLQLIHEKSNQEHATVVLCYGKLHLCEHCGVVCLLPRCNDRHEEEKDSITGEVMEMPRHAICAR